LLKYTDLSQHLHLLRHNATGRPVGAAMSVVEVWNAIIASELTSIEEIRFFEAELPSPCDGLFTRLLNSKDGNEVAAVYVRKDLDKHWKEFVAIKEMMHCFTPGSKYINGPKDAAGLVEALASRSPRYTPAVAADDGAILAAAEVILPHYTVERLMQAGQDLTQIAHHHGLHVDVVQQICRLDFIHHRKNGGF